MQDGTDPYMKNALRAEIGLLQQNYALIKSYLSGTEYDTLQIIAALQAFHKNLNQISAHIMALYTLKGQRTKITWEPLLENVDNAVEAVRRRGIPNPRTAIELAINMSEPNADQVMTYLNRLAESIV